MNAKRGQGPDVRDRRETPQSGFMRAYPRILEHAKIHTRDIKCPNKRKDLIQETIAISFKGWLACIRLGKDPSLFVSAIVDYATRQARSGRKAAGGPSSNSKKNEGYLAQDGRALLSWEDLSWDVREALEAKLYFNRFSPVPEQAAFRIDLPEWLETLTWRMRTQAELSLAEKTTKDIAKKLGLTPSAVSQARNVLRSSWERFTQ